MTQTDFRTPCNPNHLFHFKKSSVENGKLSPQIALKCILLMHWPVCGSDWGNIMMTKQKTENEPTLSGKNLTGGLQINGDIHK